MIDETKLVTCSSIHHKKDARLLSSLSSRQPPTAISHHLSPHRTFFFPFLSCSSYFSTPHWVLKIANADNFNRLNQIPSSTEEKDAEVCRAGFHCMFQVIVHLKNA